MGNNFTDIAVTDPVTAATINDRLDELDAAIGLGGGSIVGEVRMWVTDTAPPGWLLCYGQAVSRSTYASLFAIVGTAFGVGNGSTTFNLPDLRGRTVIGQDDMGGTSANRITAAAADSIGGSGGAETHTLTTAELASHAHQQVVGWGAGSDALPIWDGNSNDTAYGLPSSTGPAGSGSAHNNLQPYIALNFIIYTGV